jgi:hypothetical protein
MNKYTYAALDEIVSTLCKKVEDLRESANNSVEYYTRDGEEIPDYAKVEIEKENAIADLIEKFIEKNLNPKI